MLGRLPPFEEGFVSGGALAPVKRGVSAGVGGDRTTFT